MIARQAIGWQTLLADLSLILFMVTAAAMAEPPPPAKPRPQPQPAAAFSPPHALSDPVRAQPLAVWREVPGGIGLGPWLATQQIDSRQQLTITLRYPAGGQAQALTDAARLMREAGPGQATPRLVMEPGASGTTVDVVASLAYDRAPPQSGPQ